MTDTMIQDRTAWRDYVIRMQTRLDGADGPNVIFLVDFSLAAIRRAVRENLSLADALGTGSETEDAIAWYGLEAFLADVKTVLGANDADPADLALAKVSEDYRTRGVLYRLGVRLGTQADTLLREVTLAEDRIRARALIAREVDAETRLVWALYTLQTLKDAVDYGDTPSQFITRLDADIPVYRRYLDTPDFADLLASLATLPARTQESHGRSLQRRRTTR